MNRSSQSYVWSGEHAETVRDGGREAARQHDRYSDGHTQHPAEQPERLAGHRRPLRPAAPARLPRNHLPLRRSRQDHRQRLHESRRCRLDRRHHARGTRDHRRPRPDRPGPQEPGRLRLRHRPR
ncbi:hypothetical protein SGPA1_12416 [Streptomyces misionensis JCM 4497]